MLKAVPDSIASDYHYIGDSMMAVVQNTLVFDIQEPVYGHELWRSDGTVSGTHVVRDIFRGTQGSIDEQGSDPQTLPTRVVLGENHTFVVPVTKHNKYGDYKVYRP